jgi:hypothetical protein
LIHFALNLKKLICKLRSFIWIRLWVLENLGKFMFSSKKYFNY